MPIIYYMVSDDRSHPASEDSAQKIMDWVMQQLPLARQLIRGVISDQVRNSELLVPHDTGNTLFDLSGNQPE